MMGSNAPAAPEATDKLYDLLAVIADPEKTKTTLAALAVAQRGASEALAAAHAASADLDARESAVALRERDVEARWQEAVVFRKEAQALQADAKSRLDKIQEFGRSLESMTP